MLALEKADWAHEKRKLTNIRGQSKHLWVMDSDIEKSVFLNVLWKAFKKERRQRDKQEMENWSSKGTGINQFQD